MPLLPPGPLKVLLVIARFTYGFQRDSDKIGFKQLAEAAGLIWRSAINAVKFLGDLINVKLGGSGWGANEYSLKLNVSEAQLLALRTKGGSEAGCTSEIQRKEVVKQAAPSQTKYSKPSIGVSQKRSRPNRLKGDPRIKEFIDWFAPEYTKRFEQPYHVRGGKHGQLVKDLLRTFDLPELKNRALRLWESEDPFISRTDRGIGILASQINNLVPLLQPAQPPLTNTPKGDLTYAHG